MSTLKLLRSFDAWRQEQRRLALVTVCRTDGSTYSKSGHQILIAEDGSHEGLVSGGCLEHDLAEHAVASIHADSPATVTYDMRDEAETLFGLGVGCNGVIELVVQPLMPDRDYEPFRSMAACHRTPAGGQYAMVIAAGGEGSLLGACRVEGAAPDVGLAPASDPSMLADIALPGIDQLPRVSEVRSDRMIEFSILHARLAPIPRMLIIGAGKDAVPLARMADELGWLVTVADHRPAYFERGDFEGMQLLELQSADHLPAAALLDEYSAAIVMSHHQRSDEIYLKTLSGADIDYVGLLGPIARRDRILLATGLTDTPFANRLRSPAGLDLGADSPEGIALEILAEMEQHRSRHI